MRKYISILEKNWKQVNSKGLQANGVLIPYFEGEAGIGKTSVVKMFARENGLSLNIMNLAVADPTDLTGIPYQKDGIMYYSKPSFLNINNGILFFDEINRVTSAEMKAGLLSLFVDRKINGHQLAKDVMIVCAGNTISDKYETVSFDHALEDRIIKYVFTVSWGEWIDYMCLAHDSSKLLDYYRFLGQKTLSKYSYRRLEFVLNHFEVNESPEIISDGLSPNLLKGFLDFIDDKNYTYGDLLKGKKIPDGIEAAVERKVLKDFLETGTSVGAYFPVSSKEYWYDFLDSCRAENIQFLCSEIRNLVLKDPVGLGNLKSYGSECKLLGPIKRELALSQ